MLPLKAGWSLWKRHSRPTTDLHEATTAPERRRRPQASLTPPPSTGSEESLVSSDGNSQQSPSSFLTKLPREIRLMVYEYVLGNQVVHLSTRDVNAKERAGGCATERQNIIHTVGFAPNTHLRGVFCTDDSTELGWRYLCWVNAGSHKSADQQQQNSLGLLLSCRIIYAEAIELLYRLNTFDFQDMLLVQNLSLFIMPQRIQMIRRLRISLDVALDYRLWDGCVLRKEAPRERIYADTWKALSEFKGLRELRINIFTLWGLDHDSTIWTENEHWIVEPIRNFRALQVFEVHLSNLWAIQRIAQGKLDFGPHCTIVKDWDMHAIVSVTNEWKRMGVVFPAFSPIPG